MRVAKSAPAEAVRAVERLVRELGEKIVAVALFGSRARGEVSERSDYDFFVVTRNLKGPGRRFKIYHPLYEELRRDVTVIDVEEGELFREDLSINSLLLNVAWDGVVLYDPTGKLSLLFERIRMAAKKAGLVRYRTKDGKYGWRPASGELTAIEV